MNIALIIAGGIGSRTKKHVPKQFITINDKPIIIYTLDIFQLNENIDEIIVVCLEGWEEVIKCYCKEFGINKLKKIVTGGASNQESIYKGVKYLKENYSTKDNLIVIHAANRPFLDQKTLNNVIEVGRELGNAIVSTAVTDALIVSKDGKIGTEQINREFVYFTQTPQAISLEKLIEIHELANQKGIKNSPSTATLLIELGQKVNLVPGNNLNFKITFEEDFALAKAIINM